jgi:TonB family protein
MRPKIEVVLLTIGLWSACWGQDAQKKNVPAECKKAIRLHGTFPDGPFKFLPKESYKGGPLIKYQVQENGTVSNATLARSSGVADIDKKALDAIAHWKYRPRLVGCGVIDTEMYVTIDFR